MYCNVVIALIFSYYSGKKSADFLGVVPDEEELISKLRKQSFNSLSCLCERDEGWPPVLLVEPVGAFKSDIDRFEKVKLDFRTEYPLSPKMQQSW